MFCSIDKHSHKMESSDMSLHALQDYLNTFLSFVAKSYKTQMGQYALASYGMD